MVLLSLAQATTCCVKSDVIDRKDRDELVLLQRKEIDVRGGE